jgi:preprotein translocase subunit SecG
MTLFDVLLALLVVVYIGICVVLVLVVLMQEGKSGGLAGSETASAAPGALTDTFGAGGAQKTLFNTTSYLAAGFFLLAVGLTLLGNYKSQTGGNLDLGSAPAPVATTTTTGAGAGAPATTGGEATP